MFLNLVERMHLEIVGFLKIYFIILYLKLKSRFGEYKLIKDFHPLRIIDSSVIVTALKLAPSLKFDDEKSVMKISTMFNGEYPERINIVKGNINDRKLVLCQYFGHKKSNFFMLHF